MVLGCKYADRRTESGTVRLGAVWVTEANDFWAKGLSQRCLSANSVWSLLGLRCDFLFLLGDGTTTVRKRDFDQRKTPIREKLIKTSGFQGGNVISTTQKQVS